MNELLSEKSRLIEERDNLGSKTIGWFFIQFVLIFILSFIPLENIWGKMSYYLLFAIIFYASIRFLLLVIKNFILTIKIRRINKIFKKSN